MSFNILVVDDTKFMRKMLTDILKQYGYQVVGEAENGRQAVQRYEELRPDVVLMDITMPEMDGIDAMKEIRRIDSDAVVLICSAMSQQDLISDALKAGANGYVMKPFKPNRVNEIIRKYGFRRPQPDAAPKPAEAPAAEAAAPAAEAVQVPEPQPVVSEPVQAEAAMPLAAVEPEPVEVEAEPEEVLRESAPLESGLEPALDSGETAEPEAESEASAAAEPVRESEQEVLFEPEPERDVEQHVESVFADEPAAESAVESEPELELELEPEEETLSELEAAIEAYRELAGAALEPDAELQDEQPEAELKELAAGELLGQPEAEPPLSASDETDDEISAAQPEPEPEPEPSMPLSPHGAGDPIDATEEGADSDSLVLPLSILEEEEAEADLSLEELNALTLEMAEQEAAAALEEPKAEEPAAANKTDTRPAPDALDAGRRAFKAVDGGKIINLFRGNGPMKNFTSSYMCNWNEEVNGEASQFLVIATEAENKISIEVMSGGNERRTIHLSIDGFNQLGAWLNDKLNGAPAGGRELSKRESL